MVLMSLSAAQGRVSRCALSARLGEVLSSCRPLGQACGLLPLPASLGSPTPTGFCCPLGPVGHHRLRPWANTPTKKTVRGGGGPDRGSATQVGPSKSHRKCQHWAEWQARGHLAPIHRAREAGLNPKVEARREARGSIGPRQATDNRNPISRAPWLKHPRIPGQTPQLRTQTSLGALNPDVPTPQPWAPMGAMSAGTGLWMGARDGAADSHHLSLEGWRGEEADPDLGSEQRTAA